MVYVGLSWLVAWLLYVVFGVSLVHSMLATAIIFIVVGLVIGERPWTKL